MFVCFPFVYDFLFIVFRIAWWSSAENELSSWLSAIAVLIVWRLNHHVNKSMYFRPLVSHFYIIKLGFAGVYIFHNCTYFWYIWMKFCVEYDCMQPFHWIKYIHINNFKRFIIYTNYYGENSMVRCSMVLHGHVNVMLYVFLSHLVSRAGYGIRLYRLMAVAFYLLFKYTCKTLTAWRIGNYAPKKWYRWKSTLTLMYWVIGHSTPHMIILLTLYSHLTT